MLTPFLLIALVAAALFLVVFLLLYPPGRRALRKITRMDPNAGERNPDEL